MTTDIDHIVTSVSNKATIGGAATGLAGWIMSINWIGLLGVCIAAAGLLINWYYQYKRNKREEVEHKARLKAIQEA